MKELCGALIAHVRTALHSFSRENVDRIWLRELHISILSSLSEESKEGK